MRLLVNDFSLKVAQMGPDFLLLESPVEHPPGVGRLILQVDHTESRWEVLLPQGISATTQRVTIAAHVA